MELFPAYATEIVILVCTFIGIAFSLFLLRGSRNIDNGEQIEMTHPETVKAKCNRITGDVSEGVTAFLVKLYPLVVVFMAGFAMLIFLLLGYVERFRSHSQPCDFAIVVSFLFGALTSTFSGFLGMKIAPCSSALTGLRKENGPFRASFRLGAAMGFLLSAIGLLGLYIAIIMLKRYYGNDWEGLFEAITGYGLGASSMAFFGRTGGGIYAKAADACHHLVNEYPPGENRRQFRRDEDPTEITYGVGDIVGDIAGMGTDLFGAALIAASISSFGVVNDFTAMRYPLLISSMGILVCCITTLLGQTRPAIERDHETFIKIQLIISTILMSGGIAILNWIALPSLFKIDDFKSGKDVKNWQLSLCVGVGLWVGLIVRLFPIHHPRDRQDVTANEAAGDLVPGFGVLRWIFIPVYANISIVVSFCCAATHGIASAALGMLSTIPIGLAINACDPIRLYANRIAQMALGENPDIKTLPATEKGFVIELTALVSITLLGAFARRAKVSFAFWDVQTLKATIGFVAGNLLPLVFSDITMRSVGRAGLKMAREFQKGSDKYIKFPIEEIWWGLIGPGALVMLTPVIVGTVFGADELFGVLAGSLASVLLIAVSQPNGRDGAWNKANISIRAGASEYAETHLSGEPNLRRAAERGATVGNPWKDTSGPPLNILVQLMALESLVFASFFASHGGLFLKSLPAG